MNTNNIREQEEGLQKVRSILDHINIFMMATNLKKVPFSVCPMTLQQMDEQGGLWFFTARDSDHFRDIEKDNKVQLIASNDKAQKYLSIYGNATHIIDHKKIDELWNPMLKAWFNGKDDPNLALININMESAYYWNNYESKMTSVAHFSKNDLETVDTENAEKGKIDLQSY